MDELFDAVVDYCSANERAEKLRASLLDPLLAHLTHKFNWVFRAVQAVAILVVLQFVFVVWILVKSYKRTK